MNTSVRMLVGGSLREASDGGTRKLISPVDGSVVAVVPEGTVADLEDAVRSARAAADGWRETDPADRATALETMAALLHARSAELADLECANVGRLMTEIVDDLVAAEEVLRFFARAVVSLHGRVPEISGGDIGFSMVEPHGVVGIIVPWNYPIVTAVTKIAPALAAGNTVVVKPSELTPLSLCTAAQWWQEAGILPPGVLNVVLGAGLPVGEALVAHPEVDFVSFTGGTASGSRVATIAAGGLKPVSLELGGKSANIVLAGVEPDRAAAEAVDAIMLSHGQNCTAGSRLLVHDSLYDDVVARVVAILEGFTIGLPKDATSQLGPLISTAHRERVRARVEAAKAAGITVLYEGAVPDGLPEGGAFFGPVVFGDVAPEAAIAQDEIFGPVLVCTRFRDIDDAVRIANSTHYDLAAGVWSPDVGTGLAMARRLRAGTVWINTFNDFRIQLPYGGKRGSGWGREFGVEGLEEFTTTKQVVAGLGRTTRKEQ